MTANVLQLPNLLNANSNTFKARPSNQNPQQSTLDEITNQVYSELLQEKVESHYNQNQRTSDTGSMRSGDWGSTKSSSGIFGRLKRPDVAIRNKAREPTEKTSTTGSDEEATAASLAADQMKKPLIAKWKTGVKLQVTTKSENHGKSQLGKEILLSNSLILNRSVGGSKTGTTFPSRRPTRNENKF